MPDPTKSIGYYDDTNGRSALVFLGAPFVSPFVWLPFKGIEPVVNAASLQIEVFRKENPELCEIIGV